MFVHYTKNTNTLSKIMSSGLFINQCERKLMHLFTNDPELIKRDPQFFGITCVRHEDESDLASDLPQSCPSRKPHGYVAI